MTNEQLERAIEKSYIRNSLNLAKHELATVNKYIENSSIICFYGIKSDDATGEVIYPTKAEMDSLLVTMRNRLENRIAELAKEFAEL